MSYLCEICNKEFPKTLDGKRAWMQHRQEHKNPPKDEPKKSMSADEIKKEHKEKVKPPKLEYRWDGRCNECMTPLDSIAIEAGQPQGKIVTLAYCSRCKKEKAQRQVVKL